MSWTSEMWLVAVREMRERLRSKVFIGSNVFIVVILLASVLLPQLFMRPDDVTLGVVGEEAEVVSAIAAERVGGMLDLTVRTFADRDDAEAAVLDGTIDAALVDGALVVDSSVPTGLEGALGEAQQEVGVTRALEDAGIPADEQAQLLAAAALTIERLGDDPDPDPAIGPEVIIGYVGSLLLFGLLVMYGQWVAQGIVEEKQSRVVEVILSAVRPSSMLSGKVFGIGTLGLAQIALIVGLGGGALLLTDVIEVPPGGWGAIGLVVVWFLLGYALYAILFAISGVLVARVEDLQATVMPVFVLLFLGLFSTQFVFLTPDSPLARTVALLPFTAPIVQPMRMISGVAPAWEPVLAALLVAGLAAALIPVAARLYEGGLLATRRVSLRAAWRSVDT
jgi:ABC-2 type transport system permease protein